MTRRTNKMATFKSTSYSDVIENFDFKSIHQYMIETNWTWAFPYEIEGRVPSIEEMKETAKDLLVQVLFTETTLPEYWIQSGGFRAYKDAKTYELWLEFIKK